MTDWVFIVLPLLVLPIVLLFRFVGCEEPKPEDEIIAGQGFFPYKDTILAEPDDVVAYWRLVDEPTATVAKDAKNFQQGKYVIVAGLDGELPQTLAGSEPADGDFAPDQTSLIATEPASTKCRKFNGGYVFVEFKPGLYTDEFTIEAWIKPQWTEHENYEHTLVDAHGRYQKLSETSASWHGFRIFANRENRWQVYLAPVGVVEMKAAPQITPGAATMHFAVTVKSDPAIAAKKHVIIFVDGKIFGLGTTSIYSPPDGAPLFIGVSNTESNPSNSPKPRHPVLSPIQEVVLYRKALSPEVIKKHHDAGKGVA
jgi:Concanavalin A-like lectin/glucanases superfamily